MSPEQHYASRRVVAPWPVSVCSLRVESQSVAPFPRNTYTAVLTPASSSRLLGREDTLRGLVPLMTRAQEKQLQRILDASRALGSDRQRVEKEKQQDTYSVSHTSSSSSAEMATAETSTARERELDAADPAQSQSTPDECECDLDPFPCRFTSMSCSDPQWRT